jgi:quinol monooxygenase YgiN
MAIMLKIRWDIQPGRENDFRENQKKLCAVMRDDHPGVICYHVDYPAPGVSEWVEIYANDDVFKAHLANEKGKAPLGAIIGACAKITCRCWGDPDAGSRAILAGFGATYHDTAEASFALHPRADRASLT